MVPLRRGVYKGFLVQECSGRREGTRKCRCNPRLGVQVIWPFVKIWFEADLLQMLILHRCPRFIWGLDFSRSSFRTSWDRCQVFVLGKPWLGINSWKKTNGNFHGAISICAYQWADCSPGPFSKSFIARICAVAPKQRNKEAEMRKERPHGWNLYGISHSSQE